MSLKDCRVQSSVEKIDSGYSVNKYRVKEVLPIEHQSRFSGRQINYIRTRVEYLTQASLIEMYNSMNLKEEVKVMETPNFFIIQYGNKPPILVHRRTGRLFEIEGLGYPKEVVEHQAATLLSIWNKRGLVEGLIRGRVYFKNGRNLEKRKNNSLIKQIDDENSGEVSEDRNSNVSSKVYVGRPSQQPVDDRHP